MGNFEYDKYVAPKDFLYDRKSGKYYKQTVTKNSKGQAVQDVTWFDSQTGQYQRVVYPPRNCGPSIGVTKETRQAGEAEKAPEFSAYAYSKREEVEEHLAKPVNPSLIPQDKLDQSFENAINEKTSTSFWGKIGDNLKAMAGFFFQREKDSTHCCWNFIYRRRHYGIILAWKLDVS